MFIFCSRVEHAVCLRSLLCFLCASLSSFFAFSLSCHFFNVITAAFTNQSSTPYTVQLFTCHITSQLQFVWTIKYDAHTIDNQILAIGAVLRKAPQQALLPGKCTWQGHSDFAKIQRAGGSSILSHMSKKNSMHLDILTCPNQILDILTCLNYILDIRYIDMI